MNRNQNSVGTLIWFMNCMFNSTLVYRTTNDVIFNDVTVPLMVHISVASENLQSG